MAKFNSLGSILLPAFVFCAEAQDTKWFDITPVFLEYDDQLSSLPTVEQLMKLPFEMCQNGCDFTAVEKGCDHVVPLTLNELSQKKGRIDQKGIDSICKMLVHYFETLGLVGIFVDPKIKKEVCLENGQRVEERQLDFTIYIARCGNVRTVSSNDLPNKKTYDAHRFNWVRLNSPVVANSKDPTKSLIDKKKLDEYAYYLNRYPGRQIDIEIRPLAQKTGLVGLDYMIIQRRPWRIYANISNTGPEETGNWVTSLGMIHTQAFFEDATFRADWAEIIGKQFHSSQLYYDFPLRFMYRSRLKLLAGYNKYSSTQLGFVSKEFVGKQYRGEMVYRRNLHQRGLLFLDGTLGLDYRWISSVNNLVGQKGQARFLLPRGALKVDKTEPNYNYTAEVGVSSTINGFIVGDRDELQMLGRVNVDSQWVIIDWAAELSYYITPSNWKGEAFIKSHEFYLASKGQYAFDFRLIPQLKGVIGGLYSVRGYPESFNSGDNLVVVNAEYRYHIPRGFKVVPNPTTRFLKKRPFRANPQNYGGLPDWDFIVRIFMDMGNAHNNKKMAEVDTFLLSTGAGLEFILYDNVFIRADLGVVLKKAEGLPIVKTMPISQNGIITLTQTMTSAFAEVGDSRLSFSATLMY